MKSRRKRKASAEVNLGFQIAPMIDVVFVIMLYFMVMAGAVQVENAHNTKLPGTVETDQPVNLPDEIAIRIDDEGQVYLNDDPLDGPTVKLLPELANTLNQLRESSDATQSKVLVTIYADELARYERVIDVLDALSRAKISDVTFQAGSPE
ncbi:MAG: biopolymer transporter ExbD [Luteolibacter sp.]|uniref:ExbD/TolR family protein n=1 Tax=Luteolibacter sp. TaxID=1962973 RepID=UPI003263353F